MTQVLLPSMMTQKSNASMGCQAATENQTQKNTAALVPIAFVMAAAWINPLQSSLVFSHPGFEPAPPDDWPNGDDPSFS